jgi:hypothetical protein
MMSTCWLYWLDDFMRQSSLNPYGLAESAGLRSDTDVDAGSVSFRSKSCKCQTYAYQKLY